MWLDLFNKGLAHLKLIACSCCWLFSVLWKNKVLVNVTRFHNWDCDFLNHSFQSTWLILWLRELFLSASQLHCFPHSIDCSSYNNYAIYPLVIVMVLMVWIREFCSVDNMKTKWIHTVVISSLIVWTNSLQNNV